MWTSGRCNGRASASPTIRRPHAADARLLLCARQVGDHVEIDCCTAGAGQQWHRSMAIRSKYEQCHVVS